MSEADGGGRVLVAVHDGGWVDRRRGRYMASEIVKFEAVELFGAREEIVRADSAEVGCAGGPCPRAGERLVAIFSRPFVRTEYRGSFGRSETSEIPCTVYVFATTKDAALIDAAAEVARANNAEREAYIRRNESESAGSDLRRKLEAMTEQFEKASRELGDAVNERLGIADDRDKQRRRADRLERDVALLRREVGEKRARELLGNATETRTPRRDRAMTDESLIEWAASWVPDDPPGQRARFADALRTEIVARGADRARLEARLGVVTAAADTAAEVERERDDANAAAVRAHEEVSQLVAVILEAQRTQSLDVVNLVVRTHDGFPAVDFDLIRGRTTAAQAPIQPSERER